MARRRDTLPILTKEIITCRKCPRLVCHREEVARVKRRAFCDWVYWGRPVPGFGDPRAQLLIIGLAPAAHGANRTGRMFTGDRSGEFLYRMLHRTGFANQARSFHRDDGLTLRNAFISAAVRCAPPENRPLPGEIANCLPYLERELDLLRPAAILALGKIAFDSYLRLLRRRGLRGKFEFRHGASYRLPGELFASRGSEGPWLFAAYHPSQQNTLTGRLTPAMFLRVLRRIRRFLKSRR